MKEKIQHHTADKKKLDTKIITRIVFLRLSDNAGYTRSKFNSNAIFLSPFFVHLKRGKAPKAKTARGEIATYKIGLPRGR